MSEYVYIVLKPCPFCGASARMDSYKRPIKGKLQEVYFVGCTGCGIHQLMDRARTNQERVAAVWNRRVE